ncbi:MAG: hypothetical protein LBS82_00775 [Spirochaetaceae bacterium]|nr:hypothetical protein [Spirochaetaceae bacterium]
MKFFVLSFVAFSGAGGLAAQDLDDLFADAVDTEIAEEENAEAAESLFLGLFKPGFGIYADYSIVVSYLPGWGRVDAAEKRADYSPWGDDFKFRDAFKGDQPFGAEMNAYFGVDIRISSVLRFWQSVKFSIPKMSLALYEFYGEYRLLNTAYFKIGKYDYNWGVSPNFPYTNLLIRMPAEGSESSDMYLAKIDVPIGVGGIQGIGYTRKNVTEDPKLEHFAFGGKYNFASRYVDANLGSLYYERMPWRSFLSLKTTIFASTEVYAEALAVVNPHTWEDFHFSGSFGAYQDFFGDKLRVNAEVFYNGENDTSYVRYENPLDDTKKTYPFISGTNFAFNVDYHPGVLSNLRIGVKLLYALAENSGEAVPGVSIEPLEHLRVYFAVPMVFGNRNGTYYAFNDDKYNRPFSFIFAVSLKGGFKFTHY